MTAPLQAVRTVITRDHLTAATAKAHASLNHFSAQNTDTARTPESENVRRSVLGALGEHATLTWLQNAIGDNYLVRDVSLSAATGSDLEIVTPDRRIGIEVKTTTYSHWVQHGRSISEDQLWNTDADIYIWCAGPWDAKPTEAWVVGWSTTADVRRDSTPQLYANSSSPRLQRDPVGPLPQQPVMPAYDLDDYDFDEPEWHQRDHRTDLREAGDLPTTPADLSNKAALAKLLEPPGWVGGVQPRPGFGSISARVRPNAAVRPLPELLGWLTA